MQVRTLQEWKLASDDRHFSAGPDIFITDVHVCETDSTRSIFASLLIDEAVTSFAAASKWDDGFRSYVVCSAAAGMMFCRGSDIFGRCACRDTSLMVADRLLAVDGSVATICIYDPSGDPISNQHIVNTFNEVIGGFGGGASSCFRAAGVLFETFNYLHEKRFDLFMPVPDSVPDYIDWVNDRPVKATSIWDYWYGALRPLMQAQTVSARDIQRDRRIEGPKIKTNLARFLNARGHDWRDVFHAWQEGKEYSFVRRTGVTDPSPIEVVPPIDRPHGWQNATNRIAKFKK